MDGPLVASSGNNSAVSPSASTTSLLPSLNPTLLIDYLTEVLSVTVGATKRELEAPGSLLSDSRYSETLQKCSRFAAEPIVALYASKDLVEIEESPNDVICELDCPRFSLCYYQRLLIIWYSCFWNCLTIIHLLHCVRVIILTVHSCLCCHYQATSASGFLDSSPCPDTDYEPSRDCGVE